MLVLRPMPDVGATTPLVLVACYQEPKRTKHNTSQAYEVIVGGATQPQHGGSGQETKLDMDRERMRVAT